MSWAKFREERPPKGKRVVLYRVLKNGFDATCFDVWTGTKWESGIDHDVTPCWWSLKPQVKKPKNVVIP